jgi:transglutaminase-like putative cysteine protease
MSILSIRHLTRYRYRKPVRLGEHRMMFRPLESYDQRLLSSTLEISPDPSQLRYVHDVFGNCVGIARFATPASELVFESRVRLEHAPLPAFAGVDGEVESYGGTMPFAYSAEDMPDLIRSMERQHPDPEGALERWARSFLRNDGRTGLQALLADMTQSIHSDFRYATRLYGTAQAPTETLQSRTGTCRDFAMLMIEAVRSLGLAAQFVSGYIYSPPLQVHGLTKLGGGHTHAWLRVYLPACGWVEFDPTNGIVGNADLVRVAIARDPRQALPLWGSWDGEAGDFLDMEVEVDVVCEDEARRSPVLGLHRHLDINPDAALSA